MSAMTAVVTGGAAGLGAVIVRTLASAGYHVVIVDRDLDGARGLAREVEHAGGRASPLRADLAAETSVRALFDAVAEIGSLGLLVNNAGGWLPGPQFPDGDDWLRSLDLNLRMPMLATQLALPLLVDGGAVVNIASSGGYESGAYGSPEYGAAKAGLIRFTTATGDFAHRFGVRVSCVVPHWIGLPRAVAEYERLTADEQARTGGLVDPQVIADAVVDLASDSDSAGRVIVIRAGEPPYSINPTDASSPGC